jgi:hypothetical protein
MQFSNVLSVFASALVLLGYVSAAPAYGSWGRKGCVDAHAQGCAERAGANAHDKIQAGVDGNTPVGKVNIFQQT